VVLQVDSFTQAVGGDQNPTLELDQLGNFGLALFVVNLGVIGGENNPVPVADGY